MATEQSATAIANAFQVPLSEATQKRARNTVLAGMTALGVLWTGIVPEKISALGIDFGKVDHKAFFLMFLLTTLYFLVGFIVHAIYEFVDNRARFYREKEIEHLESSKEPEKGDNPRLVPSAVQFYRQKLFANRSQKLAFIARMIYDCLLPVIIGLWASYHLLMRILSIRPPLTP